MKGILGILKKLIFPLIIAFIVVLLFGKSVMAPFIVAAVVYFFASGKMKLPGMSGSGGMNFGLNG